MQSHKHDLITVRLEKELKKRFINYCQSKYRSMSGMIKYLIEREVNKKENENVL